MKKQLKGFVIGVVITALLFSLITAAVAETSNKTISVAFGGIKVFIEENLLVPKDEQGNIVEPFAYNGTVYLPARAVAQALGRDVTWDATTSSVHIRQHTDEVTVSTAEEFVRAIASNRKILLKPGVYDLSTVSPDKNATDTIEWRRVYDGGNSYSYELVIKHVDNLTIEGSYAGKTEFVVKSRYAKVFDFEFSSNITINNITAGHTPSEYKCDAGVIRVGHCQNTNIRNSELYGCGSIGLEIADSTGLSCENVNINQCSFKALSVQDSSNISFLNTKIQDHAAYSDVIYAVNSRNVVFTGCDMINNNGFSWSFINATGSDILIDTCKIRNNIRPTNSVWDEATAFFMVRDLYSGGGTGKITVKNTEISGNSCDLLTDNKDAVTFENCTMNNNDWKS